MEHQRPLSPFHKIGFHGDRYLVDLACHCLGMSQQFIETGANVGSTLAFVAARFPALRIYSCEPDRSAFEAAAARVAACRNVELFHLASPEVFGAIEERDGALYSRDTVFWLDSHGQGFHWPLREEISLITTRFSRAFVFIDDLRVPGRPEFQWDEYDGQVCSFEYFNGSISKGLAFRMYYPAYTDKTSRHHPLVGWGLMEFGHDRPLALPPALREKVWAAGGS